jgi:hypothetical protein
MTPREQLVQQTVAAAQPAMDRAKAAIAKPFPGPDPAPAGPTPGQLAETKRAQAMLDESQPGYVKAAKVGMNIGTGIAAGAAALGQTGLEVNRQYHSALKQAGQTAIGAVTDAGKWLVQGDPEKAKQARQILAGKPQYLPLPKRQPAPIAAR